MNHMRLQASLAQGDRSTVRIGTVSSYHPENYSCKVLIQPENVETGWLPILSPWVGNGWGLFAPPALGDMVDVHFQEGSIEAGFVSQRFFNDSDRPLPVQPGEFWLVHQSGSLLKFLNDGSVELNTRQGLTATVGAYLTANVTGKVTVTAQEVDITCDVKVTGNITATGNIGDANGAKTMAGMRTVFDNHDHPGDSGGTTGKPNQEM